MLRLRLLKGGFGYVNANFVRVEQNDPFNPGQPQIVTYEFGLDQLSSLEKIIINLFGANRWLVEGGKGNFTSWVPYLVIWKYHQRQSDAPLAASYASSRFGWFDSD